MTTEVSERPTEPTNLVVLRGTVRATPIRRELPSGAIVLQFDLATVVVDPDVAGERRQTVSVPVAWTDPTDASFVVEGCELVVTGSVRRRFFRVGGVTQSRTEVAADSVIPARRRAQVTAALRRTATALSPS